MGFRFVCALLGMAAGTKLRFGGNECENGPSFWCQNIKNSNQCSATPYCVNNEWSAPSKPDNVCETCKTAVGLIHMYLTDNKTREEVQDILDYICEAVPNEQLSQDCAELVKQETDVIFDLIGEATNADCICRAIQICSAATEGDLTEVIQKNVHALPKAQVQIIDENDTLEPIPIDVTSVSNNKDSLKGMTGGWKNTGCDICKLIVIKIDAALENEETEGEVMDFVEAACDELPSEYADQCKAVVEMYGPQIIKMLEAQLDPNTVCATLGLCAQLEEWKLPAACDQPKQVGMCRALMPSYFYNTKSQKCEYFGYGGCGGNANRFDSEEECEARCIRAFGLTKCDDCKLAVIYIKNFLDDPNNEKSVIEALDEVCQNVPSSFVMECQDMVDTYGTELIKYTDTLLDPNFVCEKMELCGVRPKKQMLVGANECTYGPAHWCSSHVNAASCGATDFCVKKGLLEPVV